jgi:hypothetical protein
VTKNSDLKKLVTKAAIRRVPIDVLAVDPSYQREVKAGHKKIVADFDETAFGVPLIGEREDCTLWIVDGLQRITAIKKLGQDVVRCEVFASKGPEHEAQVFKLINLDRTRLRPIEEFKALLTAHDEEAWKIKTAVESCGFSIKEGRNGAYTVLQCVNTLKRMLKYHKEEGIKFALNTTKEAWPEDMLGIYSELLEGLGIFFTQQKGLVDQERLIPRLQTTTPHKILYAARLASAGGPTTTNVYDVIVKLYRKRAVNRKGF